MWGLSRNKLEIPAPDQCLPGRAVRMRVPDQHFVNGHKLAGPYPAGLEVAVFGMGCFWGASANSGRRRGCGRPRSAMPAVRP